MAEETTDVPTPEELARENRERNLSRTRGEVMLAAAQGHVPDSNMSKALRRAGAKHYYGHLEDEEEQGLLAMIADAERRTVLKQKQQEVNVLICAQEGHDWSTRDGIECRRCGAEGTIVVKE